MERPAIVEAQRRRFYDGGDPGDDSGAGAEPADPDKDVLVVLDRQLTREGGRVREGFRLRRRIAYCDRHCGEIIVPPRYDAFTSDLTSVPALFTWLVPKTGAHLPAALLHDGLVWDRRKEQQTYISTSGKEIDRVEADRIFRDAMADTGTPLVRRWLVWTAVTLATMWSCEATSARRLGRAYYCALVPATLFALAWLGYVATADLFDQTASWWLTYELSWMGARSFGAELLTGIAGAIVIPTVLIGVLWGKFRPAGWILGIGVAVLFHVTLALVAVSALYVALETVARWLSPTLLRLAGLVIVIAAAVVFALALR